MDFLSRRYRTLFYKSSLLPLQAQHGNLAGLNTFQRFQPFKPFQPLPDFGIGGLRKERHKHIDARLCSVSGRMSGNEFFDSNLRNGLNGWK